MIQGRDIIVVGIQAWDIEIGSNCKNIALEFSKNNRVLYVNPPMVRSVMRKQKHKETIQKRIRIKNGEEDNLVEISKNLWNLYPKNMVESINWMPIHAIFKLLNKKNANVFAKDIKAGADRLNFNNIIIFNDSSMFLGLHLKALLQPKTYAYYMRDYLVKVPYWQKHGERIEPQVVKNADVVLTNSEFFEAFCRQYNPNSYMVGQGCDVSHFSDENNAIPIPAEFKNIPHPVIGYVGSLTSLRLDIGLLEFMAKERKDWSIVLVGPEDEDFKNSYLHKLSNVYFLGSKNSQDLPNYVKGFDVAMNPQLTNNLTIGNYPRKIDEYLAMGKPIIATKTKAMDMFKEHVYLGSTKEDYISLTEKALAENSNELSEKRANFAKSHTWENNVNAIYKAIEKVTNKV
ncbi:glycosyltransferase involved in cell wall biosynthesis [Mariniflexile fucanivorans]|uniref:Glycosyltransferase involved in cell wall biosynthesis n=1 Tax=Mariniflexile fucanivorans TaxID=264023 RepID=A0A4R1RNN6_9FLAO|nr:glycosyltransferase [Mariniflexile fucanivorans]TCL67931.1 glycosyltransferase involved in cell wall biosynthesis [Mariniflexile fucanivorans]